MIEVKNLTRTYGNFSLSLDLSVNAGETLALVGPSGSGKTTALNLIAGLAEPESGKVIIDGEDITNQPPWKRAISVVFQDLALFPHLDVGGNIAYGLFIKGVKRKERRRIIEETLNIVHLPGYAPRRIDTLSGGERQRVAIARALASNPKALLLDEPFSSLDAPLRKAMRREFLEIRSHSNAPCIFVTHDQEEAVMLGGKVALMTNGRIVETANGKDILLAPETETAARFFGAGRILPCRILGKRENGIEVSTPLGILTVPHNYNFNEPKLFVPEDAVIISETNNFQTTAESGWKTFNAKFTESIFEGKSLVLKLLLEPFSGDFIPYEIAAGKRMNPPTPGAEITLKVNQNLLRFVK